MQSFPAKQIASTRCCMVIFWPLCNTQFQFQSRLVVDHIILATAQVRSFLKHKSSITSLRDPTYLSIKIAFGLNFNLFHGLHWPQRIETYLFHFSSCCIRRRDYALIGFTRDVIVHSRVVLRLCVSWGKNEDSFFKLLLFRPSNVSASKEQSHCLIPAQDRVLRHDHTLKRVCSLSRTLTATNKCAIIYIVCLHCDIP